MAQNYATILSTQTLANSRQPLLDRDDAAASCFSGSSFPSANLLLGMLCYRTDQLKLYQLTTVSPAVWTLIYDLSSGQMYAPFASSVAWAGVTGKPTTVDGYAITDALKKTGDTASGQINFPAATTSSASIRVPHGTAPSSPVNGDVWSTTSGLFVHVNGSTNAVSFLQAAETYAAKKTFATAGTGAASANIPAGAAPTSPVDGDIWATSTQLVYRMAGVSRNIAFWDANSRITITNGGTGASDAATARTNLGLGSLATANTVEATQLGQSGSAPVYAARAWVNFVGTGTVSIRASGNVTSVTDVNTGRYTVNLSAAMPDANYAVSLTAGDATVGAAYYDATYKGTPTTTTIPVSISTQNSGNPVYADVDYISCVILR